MPDPTKPLNTVEPTMADSLFLLKNNEIINDLLTKGFEWTRKRNINSPPFTDPEREVRAIYEHDFNKINDGYASGEPQKSGRLEDYLDIQGNLVGTQDWLPEGNEDIDFPKQYLHSSIAPQFSGDLRRTTPSTSIYSYGYDDLAITPWNMLSEQDKLKRRELYGDSGTPYDKSKRPSYQQIPTKQPNLQSSLIIDEQLTPTYIKPITKYPKDVQRFTAGNYLEFQGLPSGYVNYGEGEGQQLKYQNGGIKEINNDIGFLFNKKFGI